jgi:cytochrome P450
MAVLVCGHAGARRLLTDRRSSRSLASALHGPAGPARVMSVTELDPPQHSRVRRLLSGFGADRTARLRPRIGLLGERLLDDLVAGRAGDDLVTSFSMPLAFTAQFELLGVPAGPRDELRHWALARTGYPGAEQVTSLEAERRIHECVGELLRRHGSLEPGVIGDLVAACRRDLLTPAEVVEVTSALFFDGPVLAATQIANSVLALLRHPEQLALLRAQPGLLRNALEELLRWATVLHRSMPRVATADLALPGADVQAGDMAVAALDRANRDEAVFASPDRLDLTRDASRHLALGAGIHYCLGAHLARMELGVALSLLVRRLPGLRLRSPDMEPPAFSRSGIHGPRSLPVAW